MYPSGRPAQGLAGDPHAIAAADEAMMSRAPLFLPLLALAAALVAVPAAAPAAGATQPAARGTLLGTTYDSLAGAPLAGATVQIAPAADPRRASAAIADSLGRFRFDTLGAGRYLVGFVHPTVIALGLEMPLRTVDVDTAAQGTRVELALPGARTLRRVLCGDERDSTGAIVGVARDAESELPLADATITVRWREFRITRDGLASAVRREPVHASAGGVFVVCGAPSDVELALRADAPGRSSGDVLFRVPARALVHQDLALGDTAARGARLTGVVVDVRGHPVEGAAIGVVGWSGARAAAGADGGFQVDGLASGTWTAEVRAIGHEPQRVTVELARATARRVLVVLRAHVAALDRVDVFGKASSRLKGMEGFFKRREKGFAGTFLTQVELERRHAFYVSGMLTGVNGLQLQPTANGSGAVLRGRGGCKPELFVDGTLVVNGADDVDRIVGPYDLLAAEVYASVADTPPEFVPPQGGKCGAVLLWTKR